MSLANIMRTFGQKSKSNHCISQFNNLNEKVGSRGKDNSFIFGLLTTQIVICLEQPLEVFFAINLGETKNQ